MRLLAFVLLAGLSTTACDARQPPAEAKAPQVALTGRVIDRAEILSNADEQRLAAMSEQLEGRTSDQLVVVTLDTLNGASIEQVGYALGNAWGIGSADFDNGVLLLVAPKERKVRIEVGTGLEGLLTDARAAGIVRTMLPSFQKQKYAEGVTRGSGEIAALLTSDRRRPQPEVAN